MLPTRATLLSGAPALTYLPILCPKQKPHQSSLAALCPTHVISSSFQSTFYRTPANAQPDINTVKLHPLQWSTDSTSQNSFDFPFASIWNSKSPSFDIKCSQIFQNLIPWAFLIIVVPNYLCFTDGKNSLSTSFSTSPKSHCFSHVLIFVVTSAFTVIINLWVPLLQ